jgi:hypothetical protein
MGDGLAEEGRLGVRCLRPRKIFLKISFENLRFKGYVYAVFKYFLNLFYTRKVNLIVLTTETQYHNSTTGLQIHSSQNYNYCWQPG